MPFGSADPDTGNINAMLQPPDKNPALMMLEELGMAMGIQSQHRRLQTHSSLRARVGRSLCTALCLFIHALSILNNDDWIPANQNCSNLVRRVRGERGTLAAHSEAAPAALRGNKG